MVSDRPQLMVLPEIRNEHGAIGIVEPRQMSFPFEIKRAYWLYDLELGEQRGFHAHRTLKQLFIAVSGSIKVALDDGLGSIDDYILHSPRTALYVPSGNWKLIETTENSSILLVLASAEFDESDYLRNYDDFLSWKRGTA